MPTINEVWAQAQQINANLAILHNDQVDLKNCCNTSVQRLQTLVTNGQETNDWLEECRSLVADGFAAMAAGFTAIHSRQDVTNQILWLHAQQHQTMICILEKISRNTCTLLNESAKQTHDQQAIADAVRSLDHMFATVHSDGALAYRREEQQRQEIERCCPPPMPEDPCTYDKCPAPKPVQPRQPAEYAGYSLPPSRVVRSNRDR
jgi:hypothetical protein